MVRLLLGSLLLSIGFLAGQSASAKDDAPTFPEDFVRASPAQWSRLAEQQKQLAMSSDRQNQARYLVELSSMAMALGQREEAFAALDRAADIMLDFEAAGNNRRAKRLTGSEDSKEWKGESYEKLAAFTYLGMLYAERGDLGNGLAMFKTSVIADAGTEEERFLGDWVPGYMMQAWLLGHLGEAQNAASILEGATTALRTRYIMDAVASVRPTAEGRLEPKHFLVLEELALDGMAYTMAEEPENPAVAFVKAIRLAKAQADYLVELKRKDRPAKYKSLSKSKASRLPFIQSVWLDKIEKVLPAAYEEADRKIAGLKTMLAENPNVMFVVERGTGPAKVLLNLYGSTLSYEIDEPGPGELVGKVDDGELTFLLADSLGFQATTRGGRYMDELNKKKAVARGAMLGVGVAAIGAGAVVAQKNPVAGAIAIVGGAALGGASFLVKTKADDRDWRGLPDAFYMATATLEPGTHTVVVDGRSHTFEVGDGPTIVHVPVRYAPTSAVSVKE